MNDDHASSDSPKLSEQRREYLARELLESDCPAEPWPLFQRWLDEALAADLKDATAMALATADASSQPSVRIVLLKDFDERGFTFFTRYSTRKCDALSANARAGLLFHYREHDRQIHIEGTAARLSREENAAYFTTRPRSSQLSAHAASGLRVVPSRGSLEERYRHAEAQFADRDIELPEDWGGYRVSPVSIEFWQGRPSRLHDRLRYELSDNGSWLRSRLAP